MTNTLQAFATCLAALEGENGELKQRVAELETPRKPREIRFVVSEGIKESLTDKLASQTHFTKLTKGHYCE